MFFPDAVVEEKEEKFFQTQQVFHLPFLKSSFYVTFRLYVGVHVTDRSDYVVMSLVPVKNVLIKYKVVQLHIISLLTGRYELN